MQLDLSNRVVLVTGASRGIGEAVARHFGGAGATVAVHYNAQGGRAEALAGELGRGARAFRADLADVRDCEQLFEHVVEAYGQVDILVNNAAVALHMPAEQSMTEWSRDWDLTMAVNLRAAGLLCRLAIAHFRERGGGRIVNIASRAAFRGDTPDYIAYAVSKAGVVALTRSIARGYGKDGVTAFVVAPGFTRTDMAQDFIDRYGEAHAASDIALNRLTEPEDIAPTVVFLASGLADHATGSTVDVNAGSYLH